MKTYFEFELLDMPLDWEAAKTYVVHFVEAVVTAINELYDAGIAHQDIRLENICFNVSQQRAVLIGHAVSTEVLPSIPSYMMYRAPSSTWTAEMVDWRQLAILIYYIEVDTNTEYHDIVVGVDSAAAVQFW